MKIGIIGFGYVGKAVKQLFPNAIFFDTNVAGSSTKEEINTCDVAFICVPTPMGKDGSCDTSIVEETIAWLNGPIAVIRSTVAPGTTDRLIAQHPEKVIVFQPEYAGESVAHPLNDESARSFIILGGSTEACEKVINLYQTVYNSTVRIMCLTALEAEMAKYMTNSAVGTMVTFANEFYNICQAVGANYHEVREAFLLDPRMSRYFTFVYPDNRGFGGKCLPKDMNGIVKAAEKKGYEAEFVKDILKNNDRIRKENK